MWSADLGSHRALGDGERLVGVGSRGVPAFSAELPSPAADPSRALEHIAYTVPFSISGHPAISVPWTTTDDGRPIGIQLVGRRFADVDVLALGAACERLRPALAPWPSPPASR